MHRLPVRKPLGAVIFASRWMLYPINIGLLLALVVYVGAFLYNVFTTIVYDFHPDLEHLMLLLLGFVDASMVANLIIMIAQGGHQIFIQKFDSEDEKPQYLDHIDTGILKVKVGLSITSITLVQILRDFVNIEHVDWQTVQRRGMIHILVLFSALMMAVIWRVTHPGKDKSNGNGH